MQLADQEGFILKWISSIGSQCRGIIIFSFLVKVCPPVAYPGIFFGGGFTPGIFFGEWGSTNSVEDRGQREWGSGGSSP
jgi:hypothetical protein